MRKIMFRGKDFNGNWWYGNHVAIDDEISEIYYVNTFIVNRDTVQMCVGINDKNGKAIYEGDVIDIHDTVNGCNLFVIKWSEIGFTAYYFIDGVVGREYEYSVNGLLEMYTIDCDKDIEIVGNILDVVPTQS